MWMQTESVMERKTESGRPRKHERCGQIRCPVQRKQNQQVATKTLSLVLCLPVTRPCLVRYTCAVCQVLWTLKETLTLTKSFVFCRRCLKDCSYWSNSSWTTVHSDWRRCSYSGGSNEKRISGICHSAGCLWRASQIKQVHVFRFVNIVQRLKHQTRELYNSNYKVVAVL